jgi:sugar phosphate isomerase/epimerase
MPRLAAFPKCFMDALCVARSMTLEQWIDLGATLGVEGLEMYPGFFASLEPAYLRAIRARLRDRGLEMPMLCYSPDFTQPDRDDRREEVDRCRRAIDLVASFEAPPPRTCRVLSGQRRPEVPLGEGVRWVRDCIERCLPEAEACDVVLAMENHYKDNYWQYPEFAQHLPVFREIVLSIDSPWFGVNYDPSNALLAGEDPLEVLAAVKHRVVSMHASDRHLAPGHTLDELRRVEDAVGYAAILHHGEVGRGLNDYDAIFSVLAAEGFDGWISIEDGMEGLEQIRRSAEFLKQKVAQHFPGSGRWAWARR